MDEKEIDKRVNALFEEYPPEDDHLIPGPNVKGVGEPWGTGRLAKAMGMDRETGEPNTIHQFIDEEGKETQLDPAMVYEFEPALVQTEITFGRVIIFTWRVKAV